VNVKVVGSDDFLKNADAPSHSFSLMGFKDSRKKALEFCQEHIFYTTVKKRN
jgi:hypothetical protein